MSTFYFPPRAERDVLEDVTNNFPFPLAVTYSRLQHEMDSQEPIAAAWQLRDSIECLIKFAACIAVADFLRCYPAPDRAGEVAGLLLKWGGLALGDWTKLLALGLKPLGPFARDRKLADSGYCFPTLFNVFFETTRKSSLVPSALNRRILGGGDDFVNWRNRVFGHGVFKQDRRWYADETLRWLEPLHEFYWQMSPILSGWTLTSLGSDGKEVIWRGASDLPTTITHQHEPLDAPTPMRLVPTSPDKDALSFGPMLSVQQCSLCNQPAAFFFDRHFKDNHRTFFLEYFRGHPSERHDWGEARNLEALVPPNFKFQREAFDSEEVANTVSGAFRNFENEYLRPGYLFDCFWKIVERQPKGYVHLIAPGGLGKTYFVRGLEQEGKDRHIPVLAYYTLSGALTDYRTFIVELGDRAREILRFRTQEVQSKVDRLAGLQEQFAQFITELMQANNLDTLVVAVDALDELPDPGTDNASITSLLPAPDRLPAGCHILLTSREGLRPKIQKEIERLKAESRGEERELKEFVQLSVLPSDETNHNLLRTYLSARLPEAFQTSDGLEGILKQSGGVFLYAFHFCRALESGAFKSVSSLPEAKEFYPGYLARLCEQVGEVLFETVYLPVLMFLSAAQQPVTLAQLARWGLTKDKLEFALLDLGDFLRVHRGRRWRDSMRSDAGENRYEIAHDSFVQFVSDDAHLSTRLRDAHAVIARLSVASHDRRWDQIDPTSDEDIYDILHIIPHLELADLSIDDTVSDEDSADPLSHTLYDGRYAMACCLVGTTALAKSRYHLAERLFDRALPTLELLAEMTGNAILTNEMAEAMMNKGSALLSQGRNREAVECYDRAIDAKKQVAEGHEEFFAGLAMAFMNKGNALGQLGKHTEGVECFEEAIALYRSLLERVAGDRKSREELEIELAGALMNESNLLRELLAHKEATSCCDEAITTYRRLIVGSGRVHLYSQLAMALAGRGSTLYGQELHFEAAGYYDEAASIYHRLITAGQSELDHELAVVLLNKSNALLGMERYADAHKCCDSAISIFRRLVEEESRQELSHYYASALINKASAMIAIGESDNAIECYDKAIAMHRVLLREGAGSEFAAGLAAALNNKAVALEVIERPAEALQYYNDAIELWRQCVDNGMTHLIPRLAQTISQSVVVKESLGDLSGVVQDLALGLSYLEDLLGNDSTSLARVRECRCLLEQLPEPNKGNLIEFLEGFLKAAQVYMELSRDQDKTG